MIFAVSTFLGLPVFSLHFLSLNYINRANHGMFLRLELPTQRPCLDSIFPLSLFLQRYRYRSLFSTWPLSL